MYFYLLLNLVDVSLNEFELLVDIELRHQNLLVTIDIVFVVFCQGLSQLTDFVTDLHLRHVHLFLQIVKYVIRLIKDTFFDSLDPVSDTFIHLGK